MTERQPLFRRHAVAIVHGAHTRQVTDVAPLRGGGITDGSRLLSCSADQTCRLWDVEAWKLVRRFAGHERRVNALSPPPPPSPHASAAVDGGPFASTFASASADGTVKVWDHREATAVITIAGHESNVTDVATFPVRVSASCSKQDRVKSLARC